MRKFLSSGGLGDAVMIVGKLYSSQLISDIKNIHLTHAHLSGILTKELSEFYTSQKVNHDIIPISDWSWLEQNQDNYEKHLKSCWDGIEDGVEINPFPNLIYNKVDVDIVLSPFAGQNRNRLLDIDDLEKFAGIANSADRKITYVGKTIVENSKNFKRHDVNTLNTIIQDTGGINLLNKTTVLAIVDIVCSAKTVVAPEGFIAYLAGLAGGQVFILKYNQNAIVKHRHPDWNVMLFESLSDLVGKI
jgi:hypothetical protein